MELKDNAVEVEDKQIHFFLSTEVKEKLSSSLCVHLSSELVQIIASKNGERLQKRGQKHSELEKKMHKKLQGQKPFE